MKTVSAVRVSVRELFRNKVRTLFMMVGVVIGITALTIIVSAGQGAKAQVQQRLETRGAAATVTVIPGGGATRGAASIEATPAILTVEDARAIEAEVPGVALVAQVQLKQEVPIKAGAQSTTTGVWAVTPNYPYVRNLPVARGDFFGDEDQASAARVAVLAKDTAKALFGDADPVGETIQIEIAPFRVVAVLAPQGASPGGGNLDDRIYIPQMTGARRLFNATHLSQIVVRVTAPDQAASTAEAIKRLLRERHQIASGAPDDFTTRSAEQALQILTGTSQTLTLFLSIVAGLSLLVGGFIVMNIMTIAISERKKEIGLRRAVGARRRDITLQFVLEAMLVTAAGGLIGVVLGIASAMVASRLMGWPAALSWPAIIGSVVFAAVVGLISGVQPARRAAALHPVEALRD